MKKFLLVLVVIAAGWAGIQVHQRSGPEAQAFRAYQQKARAEVMGAHMAGTRVVARFGGPTTRIEKVSYELESATRLGEDEVELVVLQDVEFRYEQAGPSRPQHRRSRHEVVMERQDDAWDATSVSKESLG